MITKLEHNQIFVFGSNLCGIHAGGAAKFAKDNFGAIDGVGVGLQGRSWAIPTLDQNFNKMSLEVIGKYLYQLKEFADLLPDIQFILTPIGTGIAGFSVEEMKSILPEFPCNVLLPREFNN